ncbi:MAG TPA: penicillin-binding transpeptidase domain-containing protein [Gammaproteobacteria bacterium]|jgi:cell division protein FtsI (penicillin-binding protein 3)
MRDAPRPKVLHARNWRGTALLGAFALVAITLEARVLQLQLIDQEFLAAQGDDRHLRTIEISAYRGTITDRHGEPLAVSTPVDSIWANPSELKAELGRLPELARVLEVDPEWLMRRITSNLDREFVYLKRHLSPADATDVLRLDIPGIGTAREYRRFYPSGEVVGHVIGFTDIDDHGQEGLELAFDYWLRGEAGSKRVVQDRYGRIIGDVEQVKAAQPGRTLRTSLDLRLQYLAYRELKAAVSEMRARSGSVVVLDPRTGEILAMVNQPSFNPNNRSSRDPAFYRNRAATDPFEPGSSFKPFVLAAALESGQVTPDTVIDTGPGYLAVGGRSLTEDPVHLGRISVTGVLAKSSNVGAGRIALAMEPEAIARVLHGFGIGRVTENGFPGESAGRLDDPRHWRQVGQATLAYGYGLSVTTLQLARAYSAIAAGGVLRPLSLVAVDAAPEGERAISAATADQLIEMMQAVISPQGTGQRAAVKNFSVAGKTGTAWISSAGAYTNRYTAVFGGIVPASDPRLVAVVVIADPQGAQYNGGGDVAAPVFARIATGALRLLAVPPDRPLEPPLTVVAKADL